MDATVTPVASLESILREHELLARAEPALWDKYTFALESIDAIKKNGVSRGTMESIEATLNDLSWQPAMFPSTPSQMGVNYALEAIDKTRAGVLVTIITGVLGILYKLVSWILAKFKGYDNRINELRQSKRTLSTQVVNLERQIANLTETMSAEKQQRINDVFFKSPRFQAARRGGDFFLALLTGNAKEYNLDSNAVKMAFPRVIAELHYEYTTLFQAYTDNALVGNLRIYPLQDSAAFWDLVKSLPRGINTAGRNVTFTQAEFLKDPNDVLRALKDGVSGLISTPTHLPDGEFLGALRRSTVLTTDITAVFPAVQDMTEMRKSFDKLQSKFITLNNQIRADANTGRINDAAFRVFNDELAIINVKFQALSNVLYIFGQLTDGVAKLLAQDAGCLEEYARQVNINA